MEVIIKKVSLILNDTLDFVERAEKYLEIGTVLGAADIKCLYAIIFHYLDVKTLQY